MHDPVKLCPRCKTWFTVADLVEDSRVRLIGMNLDHLDPNLNFYYFNHETPSCGTTFAVRVEVFQEMVDEPIPEEVQRGDDVCELHCLDILSSDDCTQLCRWAPYRRLFRRLVATKEGIGPA
jgi:hypothetical protein